jgi:dihydropteroate synthase
MSSRPGSLPISEEEELNRILPVIELITRQLPEAILSIDTYRSGVAKLAVEAGASIINDISAGRMDANMYKTVGQLKVPYILMHMKGSPADMQLKPVYENVVEEVLDFFIAELGKLREAAIRDVIIDPGFGFGKTVEHNYQLLKNLHVFKITGVPILTGISRKSMIYKVLNTTPELALNGTSALHMVALQQGARILRTHDVAEAVEVIALYTKMEYS